MLTVPIGPQCFQDRRPGVLHSRSPLLRSAQSTSGGYPGGFRI
nr:hypothetical protein [Kibdelosporangium sp. MJ126-NF4]